jgi:Mn2+/Fe2+ NRAMP family transporter
MPPVLVFLLILANDREIMGSNVNSLITVLVTAAGSAYATVAFMQTFSVKSP